MTYNIKTESIGTFAVGLILANSTSISSGSAVPYTIESGTTSHGVTVASGVITLPAGEWIVMFSLEAMTAADNTADIYVNSSIDSNFPKIEGFGSDAQSDLNTSAIPITSTGSTTVELRVNTSSSTSYSSSSDCVIYGVKT